MPTGARGDRWVEAALDLPGKVEGAVQMKALRAAARLADVLSDYPRATAHYEASLAVAREVGDSSAASPQRCWV